MLGRLDASQKERSTMLAGIAHDLRSPITRLCFRLSLLAPSHSQGAAPGEDHAGARRAMEIRELAERDLDALERITSQFLLFAGGGKHEAPVEVPLNRLLAEALVQHGPAEVSFVLEPVSAWVQPIAMARAVTNLDSGVGSR